ncbi:MAG TPA: guanitoxin biosynthesis L-enduracididine beta-hydroxylase GntD [Pyrinomonadaceae bacterium]|nr:guanitoxin biosynthesis L-enduracididine beta-hydroxylase GntD [Pyrinomonadaceae bacterium]
MWALTLSPHEIEVVQAVTHEVALKHKSVEEAEFIRRAPVYAHELPRRIREFLSDFRLQEPADGVCVISGYPIDNDRLGKTPAHWKWKLDTARSLQEQIMFVLFGSLLGDAFAWATQQDGHLMHDVFPIEADKYDQLGSGSEQLLWWHNEDAFHPYRADYLGLMCLRNPDGVATLIGAPDLSRLSREQLDILFAPRYLIKPDESHLEKNESDLRKQEREHGGNEALESAYQKINRLNCAPPPMALLFGTRQSPYLRLDPYFTTPVDDEASAALNALAKTIDDNLQEVVLQPGDCLFIDNYRIVHGRNAFKARYDGTDRWLKRINLTRDLRKSHGSRSGCEMRVMV